MHIAFIFNLIAWAICAFMSVFSALKDWDSSGYWEGAMIGFCIMLNVLAFYN